MHKTLNVVKITFAEIERDWILLKNLCCAENQRLNVVKITFVRPKMKKMECCKSCLCYAGIEND